MKKMFQISQTYKDY